MKFFLLVYKLLINSPMVCPTEDIFHKVRTFWKNWIHCYPNDQKTKTHFYIFKTILLIHMEGKEKKQQQQFSYWYADKIA